MALSKPELAFSCQATPFPCYITIRKKFTKNSKSEIPQWSQVIESLKNTNMCGNFESLEKENRVLKIKLEDAEGLKEDLLNENQILKERIKSLEETCEQKETADYVAEINRISSENSSLKLSFEKVKQELVIYENDLESAERSATI